MRIFVLATILLCSACATPSVLVRKNANIQKLGIYLEPGQHAAPIILEQFNDQLDGFIASHNSRSQRKFDLFRASRTDSSTLTIKLVATRMVSEGDQTTGVVVSLIGLSIPFMLISANAPIIVFFYYFPQVKSLTELSLSEDIEGAATPKREFVLSSPGFLKTPERQLEKHALSFNQMLLLLVSQIEKQVATKRVNSYAVE